MKRTISSAHRQCN